MSLDEHTRAERRGAILRILQIPIAERRRGIILTYLAQQPDLASSETTLKEVLQGRGIRATYDLVRDDLHWLQDADLVRLSEAMPGLWMVTLARSGEDWTDGAREVPGVARELRSESDIQVALEPYGFAASLDIVRVDLHWLAEHELVVIETSRQGERSAASTARGADAVKGRVRVPSLTIPRVA